jgi:hypothetical protein
MDLGADITGVEIGDSALIEDGVVVGEGFEKVVLVVTDTNGGATIVEDWLLPFGWEAAQIAAVDTPTMVIYEFLYLGLEFLWSELRHIVNDMAIEHFDEIAKEEQRVDIADVGEVNAVPQEEETVNTVPEDDSPNPSPNRPQPPRPRPRPNGGNTQTDGTTQRLEDEFDNDEM